MMSLEVIIAVNEEIAAQAATDDLVPFVPHDADNVDRWPPFPFPNLGYYQPDNWEMTDTSWFVDKTGHGLPHEPALTLDQFKTELGLYVAANPGHGFAITEEGEFQAVISAFQRT